MESKKEIRPVTYLKANAADLLAQVNETHRPVFITQKGEARAVLQDPESYERMRSALGLMKLLAQGEVDVRQGRVRPQEEVFADLADSLSARTDKQGG
jgi:prevent-host-death family protein